MEIDVRHLGPDGSAVYDQIGTGYAASRREEPRWMARIQRAVAGCSNAVNVGAGSGSYEPRFLDLVAVEPSETMIRQRARASASAVRAVAEQLPFADRAFDTALAILTVHHWRDAHAGLREMQRVSRRQVIVTWDAALFAERFWLVREYLPEIGMRERELATLATVLEALESARVEPLPVPADCVDGFLGAYWKRPERYLDPVLRSAMSGIALLDQEVVSQALERLRVDLAAGKWLENHAALMQLDEIDLGYRMVIAGA
jgi:hypothetical protein